MARSLRNECIVLYAYNKNNWLISLIWMKIKMRISFPRFRLGFLILVERVKVHWSPVWMNLNLMRLEGHLLLFVKRKRDPILHISCKNVVYKITCLGCNSNYIGKTKWNIHTQKHFSTFVKAFNVFSNSIDLSEHIKQLIFRNFKILFLYWQLLQPVAYLRSSMYKT